MSHVQSCLKIFRQELIISTAPALDVPGGRLTASAKRLRQKNKAAQRMEAFDVAFGAIFAPHSHAPHSN